MFEIASKVWDALTMMWASFAGQEQVVFLYFVVLFVLALNGVMRRLYRKTIVRYVPVLTIQEEATPDAA